MNLRNTTPLIAAAALFLTSTPGRAGTASVSIGGDVVSYCTAPTSQTLSLGNYDPLGSALSGSASFNFQCTNELNPTLNFMVGGGNHPNLSNCTKLGSGSWWAMNYTNNGTTYYLCYQIQESRNGTAWPQGTAVTGSSLTPPVVPLGLNANMTLPMYVQVPAGQDVPPTSSTFFQDTVTITVNY